MRDGVDCRIAPHWYQKHATSKRQVGARETAGPVAAQDLLGQELINFIIVRNNLVVWSS